MLCKGTHFWSITINSNYYVSSSNKAKINIVSLRKIINGNINMKFYYSNDIVPYYLMKISQNNFSSLTSLHVPTE